MTMTKVPRVMLLQLLSFLILTSDLVFCEGLYEGKTTAVVELDTNSYQSMILDDSSETTWIVAFYAHWCGHCVHFSHDFIHIAETFRNDRRVKFAAMDCADRVRSKASDGTSICRSNNIGAYPTILECKGGKFVGDKLPNLASGVESHVRAILGIEDASDVPRMNRQPDFIDTSSQYDQSPSSVLGDAELTVYMILRDEVYRGNWTMLDASGTGKLGQFLSLCASIQVSDGVSSACSAIKEEVSKVGSPLKKSDYDGFFNQFFPESLLRHSEFKSCKDVSCGMWRLLHLITVSSADSPGDHQISPWSAMESTRFVIKQYFSCEICRDHFVAHFDHCDFGRCQGSLSSVTVVNWLYTLHNGVNKRLGAPAWPSSDPNPASKEQAVNYVRAMYGMDPIEVPPSEFSEALTVLALVVLGGMVVGVFLMLAKGGLFDGPLNRAKLAFSKKFTPINIV